MSFASVVLKEGKYQSMDLSDKKQKICRLILSYLGRNPGAGDTLEGIAGWWLELERIEVSVDEVEDALDSLMEKGIVKMHKTADGATFYKMNDGLF